MRKAIEDIKRLAKEVGVKASAQRGQNFLIDYDVLEDIVSASKINPTDRVLEVGPGFGMLTQRLLEYAGSVVSIELDEELFRYMEKKYGANEKLTLVRNDVMKIPNVEIASLFNSQDYRVVANIPYQITGKIVKKFVSDTGPKPKDMLMLVQKEVAERICAQPGKLSLLGISVQLYAKPEIVRKVQRTAFWPEPRVDSTLLYIGNIQEKSTYPIQDMEGFWRLLRIGFSSPRKKLSHNLASGIDIQQRDAEELLKDLGLSEKVRAQELSIDDWVGLSRAL